MEWIQLYNGVKIPVLGYESAVMEGIKESGISRDDVFITTKLWNDDIRKRRTKQAFMESLRRLKTDYIDMYLIE